MNRTAVVLAVLGYLGAGPFVIMWALKALTGKVTLWPVALVCCITAGFWTWFCYLIASGLWKKRRAG